MRYILDGSGYVYSVSFGGYIEGCEEYTGAVPSGYGSLDEWAARACIQAYYLDSKGNLVADFPRQYELEDRQKKQEIDNTHVLRKEIYEQEEALEGQYERRNATGKVIVLEDIKTIAPRVKILNIQPGYNKISLYTQGRNMLPCTSISGVVSGVTFTKNASGSLTILGTSTEPIEYVIADGKDTTLFALKSNENYYLNLGGLQCELSYFDGETTAQQYIGASGLLNLPEHIEVTKVVIKIPSGESLNTTFYPQLEYGKTFTSYESHKLKALEINIGELEKELVIPSDDLHPDDELYPGTYPSNIDYVLVENGKVSISVDGILKLFKSGSMGLFSAYNTIYATKDVDLEIEYSANFLLVDSLAFLQGKATTTDRFKILDDGSIEAKDGYFKGKIEADSGYFNGRIKFKNIYDENGKPIYDVVTQITRNTVTTEYVNALNVKAGSVNAENIKGDILQGRTISGTTISASTISGGTISGSTISGGSIEGTSISIGSYFSVDRWGSIKAYDGKIAGFTIDSSSIRYGKLSLSDRGSGVYIGVNGISVGSNDAFKVTSDGNVTIKNDISGGSSTSLQIGGSSGTTIDSSGVKVGSYYTKLEKNQLRIESMILNSSSLSFNSGGSIKAGYTSVMSLSSSRVGISTSAMIGGSSYGTTVGFFGNTGTPKKTVSNLYSTTSASTVGSKLNDLLGVLRGYGLIG